ncbi:exodeoxyribonuclease I [Flammeovirga kamogawensis]|uniref:Exodeoxyribonuclease I n=1 Tax=Flammeovirga kamogawensis TaxID=373891 RepID=A0ABX8H2H7_9BACT|nr:exodeoxyribonuclease I [Flammeovirga kamogawensis]MBB6463252.1 exodeoxyribonuclease-1 [Flammeovirga kamogawensis]QWG09597.1 exodeoxyribonuclease I [Flammeovirga kamogawensis]TRX65112.1 exodeoxyribonuclease I [Flammeovirga kamogawensis]
MNSSSFFFYDYETFGRDPRKDKIAQFAGIRTDLDLNQIGDEITLYCKPSKDFLPDPEACLITGITPQIAENQPGSKKEYEFMAIVKNYLGERGTCHVGYNNIRFDDEFSRFGFYKNFIDPYSHEWADNNSRTDVLDIVRMTYALRPEGINWPKNEEGKVSLKLENLSVANGVSHENAHDALADVRATIEIFRLIKNNQPKLFQYALSLSNKTTVKKLLTEHLNKQEPILTISPYVPIENGHLAFTVPIVFDEHNKNAVIAYDVRIDPSCLVDLSAEELKEVLYMPKDKLEEGQVRPGLCQLYINKANMFVTPKILTDQRANELNIDKAQILTNTIKLKDVLKDRSIFKKLKDVFEPNFERSTDVDAMLYDGFMPRQDESLRNRLSTFNEGQLELMNLDVFNFMDQRLRELLLRYKGRNFYNKLDKADLKEFKSFCRAKVFDGIGGVVTFDDYMKDLDNRLEAEDIKEDEIRILSSLRIYANSLAKELRK